MGSPHIPIDGGYLFIVMKREGDRRPHHHLAVKCTIIEFAESKDNQEIINALNDYDRFIKSLTRPF